MIIGSLIFALNKPDDIIQEPSTEPSTTIPCEYDAEALYQQAINSVALFRNLTLSIHTEVQTKIGEEIFSEKSDQTVKYNDLGTANMIVSVEAEQAFGSYVVPYSEAYSNDVMYFSVGGGNFCTPMSGSAFQDRFAPAVLLDPTCYKTSSATLEDSIFSLEFKDPIAIENWALENNAVLISASGTATLDEHSNLLENTYSVTYAQNELEVTKTVQVLIKKGETISLPQVTEYLPIEDPNAPFMLERACGYLMQTKAITAQINESILCEAFSDNRTQKLEINMYGNNEDFAAKLNFNTLLINSSQAGDEVRKTETFSFENGNYTALLNGLPTADNKNVTAEQMRKTCQNLLLGTILIPQYISNSATVINEDTVRYEYAITNDFAATLCQNACNTLYGKPELLLNLSSSNTTDTLTAYLEINRKTSLPTSSGIIYNGSYVIEDRPYLMKYETEQTYTMAN